MPQHTPRQPFPVGDIENGQWVQVKKTLTPEVEWLNYEDLTVSSTALKLTYNNHGHNTVRIFVETDGVRFRLDGGVPTATSGLLAPVNSTIELESAEEVFDFRAIRVTNDATLRVQYGRVLMVPR